MTTSSVEEREPAFVDDLRATAPELVDAFSVALDELMAEAAAVLEAAGSFDDLVARVVAADEESGWTPATRFGGVTGRRARRALLAGGATMAALAATTGLAAASVLPAPVQRAVADVAAHVGLDLPKPVSPTTTVSPPVVSVVVPLDATTDPPSRGPASTAPDAPTTPASPSVVDAQPGAAASAPNGQGPVVPATPTPSATLPATVPPAVRQFHDAVLAFVACMRAAPEPAIGVRTCPFPDPAAFGLPGWPTGIFVPPRPDQAEAPPSSSPPASWFPPAPPPGVTTTLPRDSGDDDDQGRWDRGDSDDRGRDGRPWGDRDGA